MENKNLDFSKTSERANTIAGPVEKPARIPSPLADWLVRIAARLKHNTGAASEKIDVQLDEDT